MKKLLIKSVASLLIFGLSMPLTAFAAETTVEPIAADNSFLMEAPAKETMSLSLEEALKYMENSPQMELVKLQKVADQAAATGASEGVSRIKEAKATIKMLNSYGLTDEANLVEAQIANVSQSDLETLRNYAREMTEPNDKARKNELHLNSVEMYYKLKNLETMANIAEESYMTNETIYKQTERKFNLGTVSKAELLSAELKLTETKDSLAAAKNGLAQMRMGFNLYFGLDLMQPVALTSDIDVPPLPDITLEDAIQKALANRNELKEAEYSYNNAKKEMGSVSAYPRSSSKYLGAKAAFIAAETNYKLKPALIEQDVRTKYMNMVQYHDSLSTSAKNVANAKETLRLVQLQYDNGFVTLPIVHQTQLGYESALQSQAEAKLKYALAVLSFNYACDVGVTAASIK